MAMNQYLVCIMLLVVFQLWQKAFLENLATLIISCFTYIFFFSFIRLFVIIAGVKDKTFLIL